MTTRRYAADTSVSVERSKAEIEGLLHRYGATEFMTAWDRKGRAVIGFVMRDLMVRMTLQLPSVDEEKFATTPGGRRRRNEADRSKAWEQECRAQWRSLALVVKAKLEAVESGISTFEREFLPDIVCNADGGTLGDVLIPQLAKIQATGKLPPLLPAKTA